MCKHLYKITFETGEEINLNNINKWAKENNYDQSNFFKVLIKKRKRHKDVIKVERMSDEEEK